MREKILGETDGNQYLWSVLYYDNRGRVVQESHATHRGGWQRTNTGYDFTGHPLKARIMHSDPTVGDMTELYTYTYDAWGRPLTVTHQLDSLSPVVLHDYAYDGLGRVILDRRNGDADLSERFTYNIRSWLTDIKVGGSENQGTLGEMFTQKLYYQNARPTNPQSSVQWSGNVSSMDWMAGSDGVIRRYDFGYDGLSRLTSAPYSDSGPVPANHSRGYAYDKNGNITQLATPTDTTQITYTGNRLSSGSNYAYDANGNLTRDLGRGIAEIQYNLLNLPSSITPGIAGGPHGIIYGMDQEYLYSASGTKLRSKEQGFPSLPGTPDTSERTDYVGNLIYDQTSLKKILIDGGYVDVSGTTKNYRFFVTDHLGNNRLVTDASGTILQTNHYDPYGESLPDGAAVDSGNPYKYGGKEYDDKALAYDFGARHFTTSIPRWTTMDPMAEKYYSISPYAYCAGNPMNSVDPNGSDIWQVDSLGNVVGYSIDRTQDAVFLMTRNNEGEFTRAKDGEGNDIYISFEQGTIEHQWSRTKEGGTDDIFVLRGDDNGIELFEFFSDNITAANGVEFGLTMTGIEGKKGLTFVSTSHDQKREGSFIRLFNSQLKNGYTIRRHVHSHQSTPYPSGLSNGKADMAVLKSINKCLSNRGLETPLFFIYVAERNKYIRYNAESSYEDYLKVTL